MQTKTHSHTHTHFRRCNCQMRRCVCNCNFLWTRYSGWDFFCFCLALGGLDDWRPDGDHLDMYFLRCLHDSVVQETSTISQPCWLAQSNHTTLTRVPWLKKESRWFFVRDMVGFWGFWVSGFCFRVVVLERRQLHGCSLSRSVFFLVIFGDDRLPGLSHTRPNKTLQDWDDFLKRKWFYPKHVTFMRIFSFPTFPCYVFKTI